MLRPIAVSGALLTALALSPSLAAAQQPCTTDARRVIDEVYRRVLERPAGSAGDAWNQKLVSGSVSVRDIVRDVAKSPEHTQRFLNGQSNENVVRTLYRHVLGRETDPGAAGWFPQVRTKGAAGIIDELMASPEYEQSFGADIVPGSAGVRYCGAGGAAAASAATSGGMRFRGMDANNDGSIQLNEWNGTRQSFNVHDWNRDGVLSGDEVRVGGRRNMPAVEEDDFDPAAPGRFNRWDDTGFARLDRNRDGRIAANEWYSDTQSFRRADANGDGVLSKAEFLGNGMDDDRDDPFENLDTNGNNRVELYEWHGTRDAFDRLDRNRDGVLTRAEGVGNAPAARDEFRSLDFSGDGNLQKDEWQWSPRSFNRLDLNGDGVLSRREFSSAPAPAQR